MVLVLICILTASLSNARIPEYEVSLPDMVYPMCMFVISESLISNRLAFYVCLTVDYPNMIIITSYLCQYQKHRQNNRYIYPIITVEKTLYYGIPWPGMLQTLQLCSQMIFKFDYEVTLTHSYWSNI